MTVQTATTASLPLALYRADQVRALDAALIAAGTPGFELMQRAATAAWQALQQQWPEAREITVLAGAGNNAGDGYLLALLARQAGWQVRVLAVGEPHRLSGDAARAWQAAAAGGVAVKEWRECAHLSGVLVDALLGTGLQGAVREPYAQAIRLINACGLPVLALDIPSGLCADRGAVLGCAVEAQLTVTFIALKLGLLCGDGPDHCGRLLLADLQADAQILAQALPAAQRLSAATLPQLAPRRRNLHKGQAGHVLVAGGELGFGGAAMLAAESALRTGAGLVSLATRAAHVPAVLARRPEIMALAIESACELRELAQMATVIVVGPGLGRGAWGRSLLSLLRSLPVAQVWDADALNLLAEGAVQPPAGSWVMTPHPGEAARLLGCSVAGVQSDRATAALALAQRFGALVVLKGAGSLIATPQGELWLCERGHPAMAGAGLGDVLAGVLSALLAQGMLAEDALRLAVWLHACAGEQLGLAGRGLAAADLIPLIRQLLEEHSPCLK